MDSFRTYVPSEMPHRERHQMLLSAVAPRPIAFVGSLSDDGRANLAPFSFFNAFGANPPYLAFSPANRGTDGTQKDTLRNILATRECTVSIVNYGLTQQMNLASADYPSDVDEFEKAGLRKAYGQKIFVPFVEQSPFAMECRLVQFVELGGREGSGNLLIVEALAYHVKSSVIDSQGRIDPLLMDPVGRMGGNFYSRANSGAFELAKPQGMPVGFDALPEAIRNSSVLTGKELCQLASVGVIPEDIGVPPEITDMNEQQVHERIKEQLGANNVAAAWALVRGCERC
jgi:flavin reductase (DIM6/NTAB) family NADH-FMN oxidoreductase RutF